ncbi:MAG: amidohydrolase family protein, partial [Thermoanaerobaculia bacterium]
MTLGLVHGKIWTGDGFVDQVLIEGNRIAATAGASGATRVINLRGRLVVPGFIDNHVHFISGGLQLARVQLRDAASPAEFARRIAVHAAKLGPERWITGGSWD